MSGEEAPAPAVDEEPIATMVTVSCAAMRADTRLSGASNRVRSSPVSQRDDTACAAVEPSARAETVDFQLGR